MKPYKYEVSTDDSGKWYGNAVTFDTVKEAEVAAIDLMGRWTLVRAWRVVRADGSPLSQVSTLDTIPT